MQVIILLLSMEVSLMQVNINKYTTHTQTFIFHFHKRLNDRLYFQTCHIKSIDNVSVPCTEFEYDKSVFTSTIISEWDLVCSNKYYVEVIYLNIKKIFNLKKTHRNSILHTFSSLKFLS